jgi:hypothetical protein
MKFDPPPKASASTEAGQGYQQSQRFFGGTQGEPEEVNHTDGPNRRSELGGVPGSDWWKVIKTAEELNWEDKARDPTGGGGRTLLPAPEIQSKPMPVKAGRHHSASPPNLTTNRQPTRTSSNPRALPHSGTNQASDPAILKEPSAAKPRDSSEPGRTSSAVADAASQVLTDFFAQILDPIGVSSGASSSSSQEGVADGAKKQRILTSHGRWILAHCLALPPSLRHLRAGKGARGAPNKTPATSELEGDELWNGTISELSTLLLQLWRVVYNCAVFCSCLDPNAPAPFTADGFLDELDGEGQDHGQGAGAHRPSSRHPKAFEKKSKFLSEYDCERPRPLSVVEWMFVVKAAVDLKYPRGTFYTLSPQLPLSCNHLYSLSREYAANSSSSAGGESRRSGSQPGRDSSPASIAAALQAWKKKNNSPRAEHGTEEHSQVKHDGSSSHVQGEEDIDVSQGGKDLDPAEVLAEMEELYDPEAVAAHVRDGVTAVDELLLFLLWLSYKFDFALLAEQFDLERLQKELLHQVAVQADSRSKGKPKPDLSELMVLLVADDHDAAEEESEESQSLQHQANGGTTAATNHWPSTAWPPRGFQTGQRRQFREARIHHDGESVEAKSESDLAATHLIHYRRGCLSVERLRRAEMAYARLTTSIPAHFTPYDMSLCAPANSARFNAVTQMLEAKVGLQKRLDGRHKVLTEACELVTQRIRSAPLDPSDFASDDDENHEGAANIEEDTAGIQDLFSEELKSFRRAQATQRQTQQFLTAGKGGARGGSHPVRHPTASTDTASAAKRLVLESMHFQFALRACLSRQWAKKTYPALPTGEPLEERQLQVADPPLLDLASILRFRVGPTASPSAPTSTADRGSYHYVRADSTIGAGRGATTAMQELADIGAIFEERLKALETCRTDMRSESQQALINLSLRQIRAMRSKGPSASSAESGGAAVAA